MTIYRLDDNTPDIHPSAYVAAEAGLIGKGRLGERASVWSGAVLRGDNEPIIIGDESNVQEGAVLHTDPGSPLEVGRKVTIGHQAMLHGCKIGDGSLIGIQAVVLNGAVIGKECLVGAGAIVTEKKVFPDRSLILGAPAKVVRQLTDEEAAKLASGSNNYATRGGHFKTALVKVG